MWSERGGAQGGEEVDTPVGEDFGKIQTMAKWLRATRTARKEKTLMGKRESEKILEPRSAGPEGNDHDGRGVSFSNMLQDTGHQMERWDSKGQGILRPIEIESIPQTVRMEVETAVEREEVVGRGGEEIHLRKAKPIDEELER